jgi:hypothetical protein
VYSLHIVRQYAVQFAIPLHEPTIMPSPISVFTISLLSYYPLHILSMCILMVGAYSLHMVCQYAMQSAVPLHEPIFYTKSYPCLHHLSSITLDNCHPVYVNFSWLAYSLHMVCQYATQSAIPVHGPIFVQSPISVLNLSLLSRNSSCLYIYIPWLAYSH